MSYVDWTRVTRDDVATKRLSLALQQYFLEKGIADATYAIVICDEPPDGYRVFAMGKRTPDYDDIMRILAENLNSMLKEA